jgi:hypothetical protein
VAVAVAVAVDVAVAVAVAVAVLVAVAVAVAVAVLVAVAVAVEVRVAVAVGVGGGASPGRLGSPNGQLQTPEPVPSARISAHVSGSERGSTGSPEMSIAGSPTRNSLSVI